MDKERRISWNSQATMNSPERLQRKNTEGRKDMREEHKHKQLTENSYREIAEEIAENKGVEDYCK